MLKVEKIINEDLEAILETDFYIPIKVELSSNDIPLEELYYYRLINEDASFIEIKVNSKNKKIYEITVVSINRMSNFNKEKVDFSKLPLENGNPEIDTKIWESKTVLDEHDNTEYIYDNGNLYVLPSDEKKVISKLELPNVILLLDINKFIIGYVFVNIPEKKRKEMLEGINAAISLPI